MTSSTDTGKTGRPVVSIITPVFNRAKYLAETIESVINQTFTEWELLIIDDGSDTDECKIIAENYGKGDSRIQYVYKSHAGTSVARNHGISISKGRYLGFLDSDDCYLPNGLDILIRALQRSPQNVKMVYGDFFKYFQAENRHHPTRATPPLPRPGLYFQFLFKGANPVAPCASLSDRAVIEQIGGFKSQFDSLEDRSLWSELIRNYDIAHIPEKVAIYRKHEKQITHFQYSNKRRLACERHTISFFSSLPLHVWFPETKNPEEKARALDGLAMALLNRPNTPFDTALYLMHMANKMSPSPDRKTFMNNLEANIPRILQEQYGSIERISIPYPY